MDDKSEDLIGPSGMELLKREIDGLERFKKPRNEERYDSALRNLANRWFEINKDEFDQLKPKQITALEILADQRTRKNFKIWGWVNVVFVAGMGITSFLISPWFILGLTLLLFNIPIVLEDLKNDRVFRTMAKKLNKKFDPKLMLKTNKEEA